METCLPLLISLGEMRFVFGMTLIGYQNRVSDAVSSRVRVVEHMNRDVSLVHYDVND